MTSDISCENVAWMRVRIIFQIRIIFQYDFLITKALEMNFYIPKFGIRILNHCGKRCIFSIRGYAQVLTLDISGENIDWMRVRITFQISLAFQFDF